LDARPEDPAAVAACYEDYEDYEEDDAAVHRGGGWWCSGSVVVIKVAECWLCVVKTAIVMWMARIVCVA
jgi:hypothetical protein